MAENDTHYNGMPDPADNMSAADDAAAAGGNTPAVPLPTPGEGGSVAPGTGNGTNGMNGMEGTQSQTPVIPLPNVGEGGSVTPGSGSGNRPGGSSGNRPGGSNSGSGSNTPVVPLPNVGEGGPVDSGYPSYPGYPTYPSYPNYPGITPTYPNITITPQYFGQVRFLNASSNQFPVNISIDGNAYAINSRFGTISNYDWVSDGFHTVTVRRASGLRSILLQQNFPFVSGQKVTMVLTDTASGGLELIRVIDTGCSNLPYNSGCYRFANMSYSGSRFDLLLYGGETVFRNVGFQTVTSYKQAVAGSYEFYITNSNAYTFLRELPIIVIGAVGTTANVQQPLVSFTTDINAGQNYTSYLIGNTWSDLGLRVLTVED